MGAFRKLSPQEITILTTNGCLAEDWDWITVTEEIDVNRIHSSQFFGTITLGDNRGTVSIDGINIPCGIKNATLKDCHIGDNVYIVNIGSSIQNYNIGDNVIIQNVGSLIANPDAQFGHGVQVSVLNEAGGREVTLCQDLTAQMAYMQALYKNDSTFQQKLDTLLKNREIPKHGVIERDAQISACHFIEDVNIGASARLDRVTELKNGTILSCLEHLTIIGSTVIMKDFIVSEGAAIQDGSILDKVFVGQGVQVGKQFSAENSLFFANCEAFHSEACSIFAGPYTVTHHRSTLLIGSLFSFYNAGSGTNQSNHMYKLGPVHQGIFERGCKTGSFSYLMLECHISAFSVVIGKHKSNVNIPNFPFSYLSEESSNSHLIPGKNLFSIGTQRDGSKWPNRDRRKAPLKRDLITFNIFSPFTVEKMRTGKSILLKLYEDTPKSQNVVHYGGVEMKRLMLRKGAKYYRLAIDRYLIENVLTRIEEGVTSGMSWDELVTSLKPDSELVHPEKWVDLVGLIAPTEKVELIIQNVRDDRTNTVDNLTALFNDIYKSYLQDEWSYISYAFEQEYGSAPHQLDKDTLRTLVDKWEEAARSLNALTLADAKIEFADFAQIGYGLYSEVDQRGQDFEAVRGRMDTNAVINQCEQQFEHINNRAEKFKTLLDKNKN